MAPIEECEPTAQQQEIVKNDAFTQCGLPVEENKDKHISSLQIVKSSDGKQTNMKNTSLCDNESSCDTFCNPKCVKNIRKAKGTLTITSGHHS